MANPTWKSSLRVCARRNPSTRLAEWSLQHAPEMLVVVRILVAHITVEIGRELESDIVSAVTHNAPHRSPAGHAQKSQRLDARPYRRPASPPTKLRDSVPAFMSSTRRNFAHGASRQIEAAPFTSTSMPIQLGEFEHLGEIFGIAVFPPADARLVGIIDAGNIAALQLSPGIRLLEIGALAHMAVAELNRLSQAFWRAGSKTLFDHRPFMALCFCFHGPITVLHVPFPARTTRARLAP